MPEINAILPYFGSARMVAKQVGKLLKGSKWVGIPFAASLSELKYIEARSIVACDLHKHAVNLATCLVSRGERMALLHRLKNMAFHPDTLSSAQAWCRNTGDEFTLPNNFAAAMYFVTQWMGRSGKAGTDDEFSGKISARWNANGGDSNTRFRSAVRGLVEWSQIMRRCNFQVMDAFTFLHECLDEEGHAVYCDPPWPKDGEKYKHKFVEAQQVKLADVLASFRRCRVVVRYGDHPLIRALYPEDRWTWNFVTGRTQGNNDKAEVLIVNRI